MGGKNVRLKHGAQRRGDYITSLTSPIFSSIFFCLATSFLSVFMAVFSAPLPFFLLAFFLPILVAAACESSAVEEGLRTSLSKLFTKRRYKQLCAQSH